MPWSKDNVPPAAKKLKGKKLDIFIAVANSVLKQTGDDGKAIAAGLSKAESFKQKGGDMATKKQGDETLKASDYAYVPDPDKPSTWKLRIDDARHVAGAVAALGPGYRGQKVDIPAEHLDAVKAKVNAAHKKFFGDNGTKVDKSKVLKALNIKLNDQEVVDPSLWSHITHSISNFLTGKKYDDQRLQEANDHVESQLEAEKKANKMKAGDESETPIIKALNKELRQATYIVLEPDTVDLHGDTYEAKEVQKAAHNFQIYCRKAFKNHEKEIDGAKIVENYIAPSDMQVGEKMVKKGTWLQVWQFDKPTWKQVKKGKYNGVSIGAYAKAE